ncbi:MAG: T9SS type A sorting domain-containing protein [Flavobacteriales bacterium]|nr:T9SS type A sorting domain-containing protein [Flavobacteriales bacterium]
MRSIITCFLIVLGLHSTEAQSIRFTRAIQATDTITQNGLPVPVSSDDAEQENDAIDALYDDDLDAGWEGAAEDQNILSTGLRFRDVEIPQGVRIDSAFLIFHSHEAKLATDVCNLNIFADDTDDALTFNETDLITDRPKTTAQVTWVIDEPWGLWTEHKSVDLSAVIQEIVDRSGWQSGNSLALILQGENQGPSDDENAREMESFENIADPGDGGDGKNHPERIPMLDIYYSTGSTGSEAASNMKKAEAFPNPVEKELTIRLVHEGPALIRLFSPLGSCVYEKSVPGNTQNIQLDLEQFPAGMYLLRIEQDGYSSGASIRKH